MEIHVMCEVCRNYIRHVRVRRLTYDLYSLIVQCHGKEDNMIIDADDFHKIVLSRQIGVAFKGGLSSRGKEWMIKHYPGRARDMGLIEDPSTYTSRQFKIERFMNAPE